jgi:hypothetical protein
MDSAPTPRGRPEEWTAVCRVHRVAVERGTSISSDAMKSLSLDAMERGTSIVSDAMKSLSLDANGVRPAWGLSPPPALPSSAGAAAAHRGGRGRSRAASGRLSGLSVFRSESVLCGAFVWARRALSGRKRRFPARAVNAMSPAGATPLNQVRGGTFSV